MVISGIAEEGERAQKVMAMGPERSKPLHNFSLPCLKWGNQRFLRCMKVNSTAGVRTVDHRGRSFTASESDKALYGYRFRDSDSERKRKSPNAVECLKKSPVVGRRNFDDSGEDDDGGIEAVREKLMFDLKTAADKMKVAMLREGDGEEEEESVTAAAAAAAAATVAVVTPWNLRTRRAACKAPNGNGKNMKFEERKTSFPSPVTESPMKLPRLRGGGVGGNGNCTEKKERPKFRVPLSRKDIEEDYRAMTGERPPRRPKKRAKIVQRQLDSLFPGLWLTEVTADIYKVPELPDSGKR
ncbi:hypothetical protein L1049_007301 [Liquidambar formosana]|uniref:DUF1639 family protein n=1 Tax=Liquidambar formosana TaxID=63359 RepID=A0AAP0RH73_LIQFO